MQVVNRYYRRYYRLKTLETFEATRFLLSVRLVINLASTYRIGDGVCAKSRIA